MLLLYSIRQRRKDGSVVFSHDLNYREAVCGRGISTTSGEGEVGRGVRPVVSRRYHTTEARVQSQASQVGTKY